MDDRPDPRLDVHPSTERAASPLMFWVLITLASLVFAPCVLVPAWQSYRALKTAEALERRSIERMRNGVERQRRHLQALRSDPLVASRMALRDLAYTRPGEESVAVELSPAVAALPDLGVPVIEPPAAVVRLISWVPFADRLDVFSDRSARTVLMCLSGALVAVAVFLFAPRRMRPDPLDPERHQPLN